MNTLFCKDLSAHKGGCIMALSKTRRTNVYIYLYEEKEWTVEEM